MPVNKTEAVHKVHSYILIFLLVCSCVVSAVENNQLTSQEKQQGFKLLFDGKTMDQWRNYKSEGIKPQWQIIDGAMVLTEKSGKDLVTKEKFRFFDLRLEWAISEGGNSGIMFRVDEQTTKRLPWMVSPEYQLKDPYGKPRKSAGALYGRVATPKSIAKKSGEWNTTRILLAPGPDGTAQLRCWLNGIQTISLTIDHSPDSEWSKLIKRRKKEEGVAGTKFELPEEFCKAETGPILLQDHGSRVSFRNIRIRRLASLANQQPNTLTEAERLVGWRLLFEDTSVEHFRDSDEEGVLTVCPGGKRLGNLVSQERFSSFDLQLEFRVTPGANSGIKYLKDRGATLEYQILDDDKHPDAQRGINGNRALAALYDLIPAKNKQTKPVGQWNQARIVVQGSHVEHWLNGVKVLEFERGSEVFRALVLKSKYKDKKGFGENLTGHILLQDHGFPVSFRNIKIRRLDNPADRVK